MHQTMLKNSPSPLAESNEAARAVLAFKLPAPYRKRTRRYRFKEEYETPSSRHNCGGNRYNPEEQEEGERDMAKEDHACVDYLTSRWGGDSVEVASGWTASPEQFDIL